MIALAPLLGILLGQAVNDPNSLIIQADRIAAEAMVCQGDPEGLELYLLRGQGDVRPGSLMNRATDVQHWTLTYRIRHPEATAEHHGGVIQRSLQLTCLEGGFQEVRWLTIPVMDMKGLDRTWIAIPLAEAIQTLNQAGYSGGFVSVSLLRPRHPGYPDRCTYVFHCPAEASNVGISAQTGHVLWTEAWPHSNAPPQGGGAP